MDTGGAFRVGPQSAGADPGPACYGKGGTNPTTTDANVILGRLNPEYFLGGRLKLYPELSKKAIKDNICSKLNMDLEETAMGIIKILNHNMMRAIEMNSVRKGYDPRDFVLIAFGGAGPLHACSLASELFIPYVVIPPTPGITSAIGLMVVDVQYDYPLTILKHLSQISLEDLNGKFTHLEELGAQRLKDDGFDAERRSLSRVVDARYVGQGYELKVPFSSGRITQESLQKFIEDFHQNHEREYGRKFETEIEVVNIHVVAVGKIPPVGWKTIPQGGADPKDAFKFERDVIFEIDREVKYLTTSIYERSLLKAGNVVKGPAIIEQVDSTTVVEPGLTSRVDKYGNILIDMRCG